MKKPILYVQAHFNQRHLLAYDFCYSALMGANLCDVRVRRFQYYQDIPADPTNIVVGSVEVCRNWLLTNNYQVPNAIDILQFEEFLGRNVVVKPITEVTFPSFIKPYENIKAFTGFEAKNTNYVKIFSEQYEGLVYSQDIVDIVSEYRLYISNKRILGMRHYSGDCLIFPDKNVIQQCVNKSYDILTNLSYTLDFGVLSDNSTILIEPNDGWAIGNYGLCPETYYYFVRDRWFQLTGIRK